MSEVDGVRIEVNGEERMVPRRLTVTSLLEHLSLRPGMVVVERNGEILRREQYEQVEISAGDVLELVHFVGGG